MIDLDDSLDTATELLARCEKAVCCIYDEPNVTSVNEVRYRKFSKGAELHELPPPQDALTFHIHRENYQCYIWKISLIAKFNIPNPTDYGWTVEGNKFKVLWITKETAPKALLQMISCKTCKTCDTWQCPCKNKGFPCTDVCGWLAADCDNSEDSSLYKEREDGHDPDRDDDWGHSEANNVNMQQ